MFSNPLLQKYLDAVDIEKAKAIRRLLPLYRLGFKTQEDVLAELQVHTGYANTIHRYMVNRNILTYEQIICILRLYDITDLPGVEVIELTDYIVILVPEPQILIKISDIIFQIILVPDVLVEVEGAETTYNMVLVPEPQVIIDVDAIIAQLTISLVPEPQVFLINTSDKVTITLVPEPQIIIDLPTSDQYTISLVPEPLVSLGGTGGFLISLVPEPQIIPETIAAPDDRIFYGVAEQPQRPATADFAQLLSMVMSPVPANLNVLYPSEVGYYILAIPASAALRRRWYVNEFNQGNIGGAIDPIFGNAWPDPILQMYAGKSYQVYIGNYATQFSQMITFMDSVAP